MYHHFKLMHLTVSWPLEHISWEQLTSGTTPEEELKNGFQGKRSTKKWIYSPKLTNKKIIVSFPLGATEKAHPNKTMHGGENSGVWFMGRTRQFVYPACTLLSGTNLNTTRIHGIDTTKRITCSSLNCTRATVRSLDIMLEEGDFVCSELTNHPESQLWSDNIQKTDMAILFMLWRRRTLER